MVCPDLSVHESLVLASLICYSIACSYDPWDMAISDVKTSGKASDSASCDTELYRHASQLPSLRGEDVSEHLYTNDKSLLRYPQPEGIQLSRKAAKLSRSGSVSSKRPRLAQMEDSMGLAGVDDQKDVTDKLGSCPAMCTSPGRAVFCYNIC